MGLSGSAAGDRLRTLVMRSKMLAVIKARLKGCKWLAVANSIIAVNNGATQVQGTMNGLGERCE